MPAASSSPQMVSVETAAAHLGVSTKTLHRRISSGDLAAYRLGKSRVIRLRMEDIDRLMKPVGGQDA